TAEQDLTGCRRTHAALFLLSVERERVGAAILHPEVALECVTQRVRFARERLGTGVIAKRARNPRGLALCRVDISLHFRKRDRPLREASILAGNGIERILPALIVQPLLGAALVLDKAVTVAIAVFVD